MGVTSDTCHRNAVTADVYRVYWTETYCTRPNATLEHMYNEHDNNIVFLDETEERQEIVTQAHAVLGYPRVGGKQLNVQTETTVTTIAESRT